MRFVIWGLMFVTMGWAITPFTVETMQPLIKAKLQEVVTFSGDFDVVLSNPAISVQPSSDEDRLEIDEIHLNSDQRSFQVSLAIVGSGARQKLKTLSGKIIPLSDIPVLTRAIAPGEEIAATDINWHKLPSSRLTQNFILSQDDLVGKTPKGRVLQPGQPVSKHDVRYPIVIKRGDTVTVAYRTGTMMLTTTAIAEMDAATGDSIRLKTASSKIIQAKVLGPQKAEIKPMEF